MQAATNPRRLAALCPLGLAALLLAASPTAQADTLRQIFDKAWQLAPQGRVAEARRGEAEASRGVAQSLLAGAPQITIGQRSDRWNDDLGKRENEVALALPLWLPGQRNAQAAVAAADGSATEQGIAAARLALAGELRSALWNLILTRNEAAIMGQRLAALLKLEEDVGRRVKAGDAARTDLLLAQQERSQARAASLEAEARVVRASQRYRVLTGSEQLPSDPEEALRPALEANAAHPRIATGQASADRARAGLQLAQAASTDAPSLALQYRRDREGYGATNRDSVGIALSIPFATGTRNAPRIASANTALIEADAELQRTQAEVEAELLEAEALLSASRLGVELAGEREQAASERLRLLRRAFDLGETALSELLRAQAQASEATLELARSRARLSAALANLNQARGFTP